MSCFTNAARHGSEFSVECAGEVARKDMTVAMKVTVKG